MVTGGHRGQQRILTTIYGIRFDGDEVVYPFGLLVPALMKKNYPGLAESLKEFRKEKAQRKELAEDPTVMLDVYDRWLAQRAQSRVPPHVRRRGLQSIAARGVSL